MVIKLTNVVADGNGGNGIHIVGDNIEGGNLTARRNGGTGVYIASHQAEMTSRFPILAEVSDEDLADARLVVSNVPQSERLIALQQTRLGKWLSSQQFVAWASLAAALVGVFK